MGAAIVYVLLLAIATGVAIGLLYGLRAVKLL